MGVPALVRKRIVVEVVIEQAVPLLSEVAERVVTPLVRPAFVQRLSVEWAALHILHMELVKLKGKYLVPSVLPERFRAAQPQCHRFLLRSLGSD